MKRSERKPPDPARRVKLTAEIPADVDTRLHALAGHLGLSKRELVATLLDAGLRRYQADRMHRKLIDEMIGPVGPVGSDAPLKLTGS